ncbi:MAG: OmpH family outer membrane protein [Phycisphaeraceae bacterium]|nr:OmpH family outer membrane protein [Phycisphaeraceae bacterium]
MQRTERIMIYAVLAVCLVLGFRAAQSAPANAGQPTAPPPIAEAPAAAGRSDDDPAPARIAMCDIYDLIEKLVVGDRFEATRKAEEERIRQRLKPLEDDISALESQLKLDDPDDPAAQARARDYQKRRNDYSLLRGQAQQDFNDFVARQYIEAYDKVRAAAAEVAGRRAYTHVIASRHADRAITATDPERLVESFLGRPVVVAPAESDITAEVAAGLNLR